MAVLKYWDGAAWQPLSSGGITLPLSQNLTFAPDATYDIGASGASRPRDLNLSRQIKIGPSAIIRNPATAAGCLSLEAPGASNFAILSAEQGSNLTCNLYYDGTNWQRYNVANQGSLYTSTVGGAHQWYMAASGANPASLVQTMSLDSGGSLTIKGQTLTFNGALISSDGNVSFYQLANQGGQHWFRTQGGSAWATCLGQAFTPQSARRSKSDIATLADPLGVVMDERVHGVSYTEIATGNRKVGFVADDWLSVLPNVVVLDAIGDVIALDYDRISAVTFEALKQYIAKTEARFAALENR